MSLPRLSRVNGLTVDSSLSSSFGSRHCLPPPSTDRLQTADISCWYPSTCCHYLKSSMTRCSNGRIQSSIRLPLLQLTLNERSLTFIFSGVNSPLYYDSFSHIVMHNHSLASRRRERARCPLSSHANMPVTHGTKPCFDICLSCQEVQISFSNSCDKTPPCLRCLVRQAL